MFDYDSQQDIACSAKSTPLDRINDHANAASRIGDLIAQFLDRFHNGAQESRRDGNALEAVPTGHAAQLDRLEKSLGRAEELARQLSSIG